LLLPRRAVLHQGWPEHRDATAIDDLRRLRPSHLLIEDDHLGEARAASPELVRPVHPDVPDFEHLLLPPPKPHELFFIPSGRGKRLPSQIIGQLPLEPSPNFFPKVLFVL